MSIIVLGSINTDLVIRSSSLPQPGETILGGEFYRAAGGKGANPAVAAARSSREPVTFLAAVGDDSFGRESLAGMRQENLDTRFLKVIPDQPSERAVANVPLKTSPAAVASTAATRGAGRCVTVSPSSTQQPCSPRVMTIREQPAV